MSQSTAVRVARRPARPAPRTPRRQPAARPMEVGPRAGVVVGCLVLLTVGLVGRLLLNLSLEQGAFVLKTQQGTIQRLQERRQALAEEVASLEAPQSLERRAAKLGMVEAPNVAFVRTSDGRVIGVPSPAVASKSRSVAITSPSPAPGRGSIAGPAASPAPSRGAATRTAKVSTKVTATGKAAATTTATRGAPAGRRTGAGGRPAVTATAAR
jgi:hypothetical protein